MDRMIDILYSEISKIADKGLTTANIETAYKLIDMLKDLKTVEAMGGHSVADDAEKRYLDAKRSYRNDHSLSSKASVLDALDEHMDELYTKLREMKRDADTQEERDLIDKYIKMIDRA